MPPSSPPPVPTGAATWRQRFFVDVVARGVASEAQWAAALQRSERSDALLAEALVLEGCPADGVLAALCGAAGLPPAPPAMVREPDVPGGGGVPLAACQEHLAVPFSLQGGQLHVAFGNPDVALRALELGFPFHRPYLAAPADVRAGIARLLGSTGMATPMPLRATAVVPRPQGAAEVVPLVDARAGPGPVARRAVQGLAPGMATESLERAAFALPDAPPPPVALPPGMATESFALDDVGPPAAASRSTADDLLASLDGPGPSPPATATASYARAGSPVETQSYGAGPGPADTHAYGAAPSTPAVSASAPTRQATRLLAGGLPGRDAAASLFDDEDGARSAPASATARVAAPSPLPASPAPPPPRASPSTEEPPLRLLEPGTAFAGYEIERVLGRGGMAVVYLARVRTSGATLALKVMAPKLADDVEFVERFRREVQACMKVDHPHVLRVHSTGVEQGSYWMASEYVDGGSVEDLLRRAGPLPAPLAAELIDQLLDALGAAHRAGIVHRDIKPANLLLTSSGVLKLADFGIARSRDNTTLTQTGFLVGTPAYMSPEQVNEGHVDARSDLFSAGTVLYELLAGRNPYHLATVSQCLQRVMVAGAPPLFEVVRSVPPVLEELCARLGARRPEDRPVDAAAARAVLAPHLARWQERYGRSTERAVAAPEETVGELRRRLGEEALEEAAALLAADPPRPDAATLRALAAADALGEETAAVVALLRKLKAEHGLDPRPALPPPRVAEVEAAVARDPESPGLLMRAAQVQRAEGNPWRYALHLKRYLLKRPDDTHARAQLEGLLRPARADDDGDEPLTPLAQASTDTLIRGIKTGGFKAADKSPPPRVAVVQVQGVAAVDDGHAGFGAWLRALGPRTLVLGLAAAAVAGTLAGIGSLVEGSRERVGQGVRPAPSTDEALATHELTAVDREQASHLARARARLDLGDARGALRFVESALELDRKSPLVADLRVLEGRAHAALGDPEKARLAWREALVLAGPGSTAGEEAARLLETP